MATLVALVASPAWAGDDDKGDMDAMMKEMANCNVCKNMVEYMPELGPVMSGEVVKLSNGVAIIHTVSDPGKIELMQKAGKKMGVACAAAAEMSDAEAEGKLCTICSDVRIALKAGAEMGAGTTKNGDMFVLTSNDPKVQAKIAKVEEKFAMALAGHGH
jgi:hypothetical protein